MGTYEEACLKAEAKRIAHFKALLEGGAHDLFHRARTWQIEPSDAVAEMKRRQRRLEKSTECAESAHSEEGVSEWN